MVHTCGTLLRDMKVLLDYVFHLYVKMSGSEISFYVS